jgi:hypothetical protein
MKELRPRAAVRLSILERPGGKELIVVGGPALEYAPYEDLCESHDEALMRTLEDGERPSSGGGGHIDGHVGEIDCAAACYLLSLTQVPTIVWGVFAGRGGDVVGLDVEVQAASVGHYVVCSRRGDSRLVISRSTASLDSRLESDKGLKPQA